MMDKAVDGCVSQAQIAYEKAKKYIKETVLTYLMEMIPSTTIVEILFKDEETLFNINNTINE